MEYNSNSSQYYSSVETISPFLKKIFKLLYYFSGSDSSITSQLIDEDGRPYRWIGVLNIILAIPVGVLAYFDSLSTDSDLITRIAVALFSYIGFIYFLKIICWLQVKTINAHYRIYIVTGTIITNIILGFSISFLYTLLFDNGWYKVKMNPIIIYSIIGFAIILYNIPIYIIYRNRNDFYHSLLEQKKNVLKERLQESREKISENFKIKTEIQGTKQSLDTILGETEKDSIKDILTNFENADDAKSLESYGDYQFFLLKNYEKALEIYNHALSFNAENIDVLKKKTNTLRALQKIDEAKETEDKFLDLEKRALFSQNLSLDIYLKKIVFSNTNFYGAFEWPLQKNINILLGRNGYGKSHLLSIILSLTQSEVKKLYDYNIIKKNVVTPASEIKILLESNKYKEELNNIQTSIADKQALRKTSGNKEIDNEIAVLLLKSEELQGLITYSTNLQNPFGKIPVLAIPDLRFINKSNNSTQQIKDDKAKSLLDYGAYHFIEDLSYEDVIQNFLTTIGIIYSLKRFDDDIFGLVDRVFKRLTGNTFEWEPIKPTQDKSGFIIKVKTEGTDEFLPIQKVSQGTLSILSIIGLIYNYLTLRYPHAARGEICKQTAVVFIDEIDAHLHPSWQQKLIGILRKEFPNIQFIITAHSPLIVAGSKEGEVSILRKSKDGFSIKTIDDNFIGISISEIFKRVFEIEENDETFNEIAALMPFQKMIEARIAALAAKAKLSATEQAELEKLQRQQDNFIYFDQVNNRQKNLDDIEQIKIELELKKMDNEELENKLNTLQQKNNLQ